MKGESVRTTGVSLLAAAVALLITAIAGCADKQQSTAQPQNEQTASSSSPQHVDGLCKLPDMPPADLAHKPGYRQFSVSVTEASGRPISGLKQQDFVLSEESRTFPVAYFRENKNDEPVAIALVVDTSGSMQPKLPTVKRSLGNLVENLNRCDEVTMFAFSGRPFLLMPLSTDHQVVARKMELFHAYGQTALYDATNAALRTLADAEYPDRKIIVISDGMDNSSRETQARVSAQARKDGVPIYAVGIGEPDTKDTPDIAIGPFVLGHDEDRVDAKGLEALSAAAGGRTFMVSAAVEDAGNGFMDAIAIIADTIARGYAVGAVIPADVVPSRLNVAVENRPALVVRAHLVSAAPSP
jgi:VWFA-related protein